MNFGLDLRELLNRVGAQNAAPPQPGAMFDPTANLNMAGLLGGGQYGASRFISPGSPNVTSPASMTPFTGGAASFTQGPLTPSYFGKGGADVPALPGGSPFGVPKPPAEVVPPSAPPGYIPRGFF